MGINYAKLFANNMSSVIKQNAGVEKAKVKNKIDKLESTDLGTLKGIGDTTVKQLLENGISSLEELKEAGVRKVNNLKLNPFSLRAIKEFLQSK